MHCKDNVCFVISNRIAFDLKEKYYSNILITFRHLYTIRKAENKTKYIFGKKNIKQMVFRVTIDCWDNSNYSMTDSSVQTEFEFGEMIPVFYD